MNEKEFSMCSLHKIQWSIHQEYIVNYFYELNGIYVTLHALIVYYWVRASYFIIPHAHGQNYFLKRMEKKSERKKNATQNLSIG